MHEDRRGTLALPRSRRSRSRRSAERPTDQHGRRSAPPTDKPKRSQQIRAATVVGAGIPIGHNDAGALIGNTSGERTHRRPGVGLRAVPHQDRALRGIAVHIGTTTRRVFDCLHRPRVPGPQRTYARIVNAVVHTAR